MTLTDNVYSAYINFCTAQKLRALPINSFGSRLAELGIIKQQKMKNRKRDTYYIGLNLRSDLQEAISPLV